VYATSAESNFPCGYACEPGLFILSDETGRETSTLRKGAVAPRLNLRH